MKLRPLRDCILIRRIRRRPPGGIVITDIAKEKQGRRVHAVRPNDPGPKSSLMPKSS